MSPLERTMEDVRALLDRARKQAVDSASTEKIIRAQEVLK